MQMRVRVGVVAVMLLGAFGLTGCVQDAVIPTLPPTPSSGPIFASEEEALAAAEAAYAAYLEMSNLISSEGGENPERIAEVAARDFYDSALEGFSTLVENGWRTTGSSRIEAITLQFADLSVIEGEEVVAAYVCVDFKNVDVLDSAGESVVSPDRPDLQAFEVFFDLRSDGALVPSDRNVWSGSQVCGLS